MFTRHVPGHVKVCNALERIQLVRLPIQLLLKYVKMLYKYIIDIDISRYVEGERKKNGR